MKTSMMLIATCLLSYISIPANAKTGIEGTWTNTSKGLTVYVETTTDGIRVRRADQERWYEYEEYRVGQYRDTNGHNYYLVDGSKLEWERKDGNRRIVFSRSPVQNSMSSEGQNRSPSSDVHIERNHFYWEGVRPSQLEGRWKNLSTGQSIYVRSKGNLIKVRAHKGTWTTFVRDDRNTYFDNRGNRYDITPGELTYQSKTGDFRMVFIPS